MTSASGDENNEEKPVEEPKAGEDEVLQNITLALEKDFEKASYARTVGETPVTVAKLTIPAEYAATKTNCTFNVSDMTAPLTIAQLEDSAKTEFAIIAPAGAELPAKEYTVSVDVTMGEPAEGQTFTKGAHRKVTAKFKLENKKFDVTNTEKDTVIKKSDDPSAYDAIWTFPAPTKATPQPAITGITVQGVFGENGDPENITEYEMSTPTLADVDATKKEWKVKSGDHQTEQSEIITFSASYHKDYKIKLVVPAYQVTGGEAYLTEENGSAKKEAFTYVKVANGAAFKFKLVLPTSGDNNDNGAYQHLTSAKIFNGTTELLDIKENYGKNNLFTIPADKMKEKVNPLTSNPKIVVQVGKAAAAADDDIKLEAEIILLAPDMDIPSLGYGEEGVTYSYVKTSKKPGVFQVNNPVKGMNVSLDKSGAVAAENYSYNDTTGELTITGEYLESLFKSNEQEVTLTVNFSWADGEEGNKASSKIKITPAAGATTVKIGNSNSEVPYAFPADAETPYTEVDLAIGDLSAYKTVSSVYATYGEEEEKVELPSGNWALKANDSKVVISKDWFETIRTAQWMEENREIEFHVVFEALLDGSSVDVKTSNKLKFTGVKDAEKLAFTFNDGKGVEKVLKKDGTLDYYYTVLEITKKPTTEEDAAVEKEMNPFDLEPAFDGANGKKLYEMNFTLESNKDNVTVKKDSTMLIPASATVGEDGYAKVTLKAGVGEDAYPDVVIRVYVVDKTAKQTAVANKDFKIPGVTVNGSNTEITLTKTGDYAKGEFDLAELYHGIALPPYLTDAAPDAIQIEAAYVIDSDSSASAEDKAAAKAVVGLSGTKITALANTAADKVPNVKFKLTIKNSANGFIYNDPAEITVTTKVVDAASDTITVARYESQDEAMSAAEKAALLKAYDAAGITVNGNTISLNGEKFQLAMNNGDELKALKNNTSYVVPVLITTSAKTEGTTVKYEISETLTAAQGITSPKDTYEKGIKREVAVHNGTDFTKVDDKFFITWEVTTGAGTEAETKKVSVSEVTVKVAVDEKTQTSFNSGAWEIYTPANTAGYAASGITVTGSNVVYNESAVNKDAQNKLDKIYLMVKAPAGATSYAISDDLYTGYEDKTFATGMDPKAAVLDYSIAELTTNPRAMQVNKYIRWKIETPASEGTLASTTYSYTKASSNYYFTKLSLDELSNYAFSEKKSKIALTDNNGKLPADALAAGGNATGIKLNSEVVYQGADGRDATPEEALTKETTVKWDYEFTPAVKTEKSFPDMTGYSAKNGVDVKFGAAETKPGAQTMDIRVSQYLSKGGTLVIKATFKNTKIISDITKTITLKINPPHYVEDAIPSVNTVQLMLTDGRTVSYSPKVTLYPNAKAMFDNKDTIWTVTAANDEAKATIDAKTGKATFDKAGKYTLIATYKAKKLGSNAEEELAKASINVVVVDKNSAYKSLALKNSKDDKVVDLFKTTDSTALTETVPVFVAKDANGEYTIDPKGADYADYKDLISYQIVQGKNNAEGADIQIDANGNITADVTKGGATAKVTALMMGKSVTFTVNAYTTSTDDKVQMILKNGETALTSKTPPEAGVTYKYSFATTGKTNAPVAFDYNTAVITGDNKSLIETKSYEIDPSTQSITFTKPVSGKLNFTFPGDPKSRKGSYAVNTSKNAEPPTSIYFGSRDGSIWQGKDAYLDYNNRFVRTGPSDATLTIWPVLTPSWANNQLTWAVSNSKLATIKAGKNGEAVLTWKKAAADGEQLFVTATSKDKNAKTSYTMQLTTVDELEDVYIEGNPKSIFINVADNSVGTMLPLSRSFTSVDVVTYDKKDKKYVHAEGYDASIQDNIVTLRASSTAKSGKFFLELEDKSNDPDKNIIKPDYVAITTKLAKVTDKTAVSITGKVAAINNHVYGYMAPITLAGKNIDPLAAMLEMDASVSEALNLSLVKEDGQWYLKYTGETVADKARTAPATITIKCSVPGVKLTTESFPLKVAFKAASADYGFTVKPAKLLTLGGNIPQDTELYLDLVSKSGILDRALKNNEITDAELVTGKAKGTFLGDYMKAVVNPNNNDAYGINLIFGEDDSGNKIKPASMANGKYVANLKVTYKGGATAEAPITLTVNTDTSAKTVKISKATITGAMPILSSSLSDAAAKSELASRGAYLTFTKSADLANYTITDVRVTSPAGFVVNGIGDETFQIAYKGEASAYNTIKGKLTLEVALGGKFDAEDKAKQPVVTATVQVAKPSAGYDKLAAYTIMARLGATAKYTALEPDLNGNYSAEMTVGGAPLELAMLSEGSQTVNENTKIKGMTMISDAPAVVKANSYDGTLDAQGESGKAIITISKPGYVESTLTVNVKGAEFALKTSEKLKATATGYTFTTKFDPENKDVTLASLFETAGEAAKVTAVVPTAAQDTVTFDGTKFKFYKATTGTKVTLKKAFADDIELTFVVTPAESRPTHFNVASKEFVEIKDNAVTIKGLVLGGTQKLTLPTPYQGGKWTAKSNNSASVTTEVEDNLATFERKADAAENVTVTLSMDGYEDITVTIEPSKKSKAELLDAVAALQNGFGDALWVANGKGTLTLKMGATATEIAFTNFKVDGNAVTIDATGATGFVAVTTEPTAEPTKYTIAPVAVTGTATPKIKLSAKGYEDAEITLVVKAAEATEDKVWAISQPESGAGTGTLAGQDQKRTLKGLEINASNGTDEAVVTFTRANGDTATPALTITPATSDGLAIGQTTSEGVVTVKFKATKYIKDRVIEFTAPGYKPMTITVSTKPQAAADMVSHLNISTGNNAILVNTAESGQPAALQLNLTMGNEIPFNFGKDIDVEASVESAGDYVSIDAVSTGSTTYKITPKKPIAFDADAPQKIKLTATDAGYNSEGLEVTLNIAKGTATPDVDKDTLVKDSTDTSGNTYTYILTGSNSPATITFKDSKGKPIKVASASSNSSADEYVTIGDDEADQGKIKLTYKKATVANESASLKFEFNDTDNKALYNEVTIKVTVQESETELTSFIKEINTDTVKASATGIELFADTLEVADLDFLNENAPEIIAQVVTVSNGTDAENDTYADVTLTDKKLTVTGKQATGDTELFLKLTAKGFKNTARIPLIVKEGKAMTFAAGTTANDEKVDYSLLSTSNPTIYVPHSTEIVTYTVKVTGAENDTNPQLQVKAASSNSGITGAYTNGVLTFTVAANTDQEKSETFTLTGAGYQPKEIVVTVQMNMTIAEKQADASWTGNTVKLTIPTGEDETKETFKITGKSNAALTDVSISEETPGGVISMSGPNEDNKYTITVTSAATADSTEKITITKAGYAPLVITVKTEAATPPAE